MIRPIKDNVHRLQACSHSLRSHQIGHCVVEGGSRQEPGNMPQKGNEVPRTKRRRDSRSWHSKKTRTFAALSAKRDTLPVV